MNPLVELRSVGSAQLWPTRKQKETAEADIVSLYRARLEGFQRDLLRRLQEAGVLQNAATAEKSGTVSEASSASSASSPTGTVSRAGGELGKDAFLQLLVTQMQYQDPLSPMDNTDMIAQLAQFSALEQMNNLNATTQSGMNQISGQMATLSLLGAQNLIGRTVSGLVADTNVTVSGRVIGVSLEEQAVLLTLEDGTRLPVGSVTEIRVNSDVNKTENPGVIPYPSVSSVPAAPVPQGVATNTPIGETDIQETESATYPINGGI